MTPDAHTNKELFIEVDEGHELYVHDWGRADAKTPIIFLHGGPGGASKDRYKPTFDPERQRVIFFDQRGCGRSMPYGSLEHNTTDDMIGDITKIADKLGIEKFILKGGSWGSCLALAYALKHPERVKAMVLDGIFTGSQKEIDWLDQGMFQTFFPDVWQAYLDRTPENHRKNPSAYHFKRALEGTPQEQKESSHAYESLEGGVIQLDDRPARFASFTQEDIDNYDPHGMRMEMYYMRNRCFMPDRYILDNAHKLSMPIYLVQGRYDMVCPPTTAYELHQQLPNSELIWTVNGHIPERESWTVIRTIMLELSK